MGKFTAAGLVVFYQKVADGGTMFHDKYHTGKTKHETSEGPDMESLASEWSVLPKKPAKKIIDLEPFIASGIDCEFWSEGGMLPRRVIHGLGKIGRSPINSPQYYGNWDGYPWDKCRPRMNHKMCWDGSKPIEGFIVKAYFDRSEVVIYSLDELNACHWPHVRAIEFLGVEDGYAYPWEQAK